MKQEIIRRLLDINYQFYQTFAEPFSASRGRLQPGVRRAIERLVGSERILDIGCGNGNLWKELSHRGHAGAYTGLDFSLGLLEHARASAAGVEPQPQFLLVDLLQEGWEQSLPHSRYDLVLAFAVLHHIPGSSMRNQLLSRIHALLVPHGRMILSVWQFMNSARLRGRVQDWSLAGIDAGQVEAGDYLLDWRQGGSGLRYVHLFDLPELAQLAVSNHYQITSTSFSDGNEGNLGCYQVWEALQR